MRRELIKVIITLTVVLTFSCLLSIANAATTFNIDDVVEVYNTETEGLVVRDPACGSQIGGKFDGAKGIILEGPNYCDGYSRWRIRWYGDNLEGWSAEDWLKEIIKCSQDYTGNKRCSGNWIQKEYQNDDCSKEWKNYESCDNGCKNGECIIDTPQNPCYSTSMNLKTNIDVTAKQIDDFIKSKHADSPLIGLGQSWIDAADKYKINPVYLMAHAILESGWGFSNIAQDKYNIYGYGAYDSDPYNKAYKFSSYEECVDKCAGWINTNYLMTDGKYFNGATLEGMNVRYATSPDWAASVASVMNSFAVYIGKCPIADSSIESPNPIITFSLKITPEKEKYYVGDTLTAKFTITNKGTETITFDKLTVGGRLNGDCPDDKCPDFTFSSTTLQPNTPYQYTGTLTLNLPGEYHFFTAYYIKNPTSEEKKLLDENNWNTYVELGEGLADKDRTRDIIAFEKTSKAKEPSTVTTPTTSTTSPITENWGNKAVSFAEEVVGAPYLGDGLTWGGKGYEWNPKTKAWSGGKFVDSATIKTGYHYSNAATGQIEWGKGLDCSGLVYWSYNKASGSKKYVAASNPISSEKAKSQWENDVLQNIIPKSTKVNDAKISLKPGDLLFFPKHVAMYVGNGYVIHSTLKKGVIKEPLEDVLKIKDFKGYGRVKKTIQQKMSPSTEVKPKEKPKSEKSNQSPFQEIAEKIQKNIQPIQTVAIERIQNIIDKIRDLFMS